MGPFFSCRGGQLAPEFERPQRRNLTSWLRFPVMFVSFPRACMAPFHVLNTLEIFIESKWRLSLHHCRAAWMRSCLYVQSTLSVRPSGGEPSKSNVFDSFCLILELVIKFSYWYLHDPHTYQEGHTWEQPEAYSPQVTHQPRDSGDLTIAESQVWTWTSVTTETVCTVAK